MKEILSDSEYDELIKTIVSGCKFKYYSYDHKKAIEEYQNNSKYSNLAIYDPNPDCYRLPNDLKLKYRTERIGKLRTINFGANGRAYRFYIGARYSKTFFIEDFGVNVFPLI